MPITILSWGGIGDTLRNISLIPHEFLFQRFGIRCKVVYRHWKTTGALAHAEPPEAPFFEALIGRIPSLVWAGESGRHEGVSRALNKALRETIKRLNGNTARYFPFTLQLTPSESAALPQRKVPTRLIGIQTHLSGMMTKRWGMENWRRYLTALLAAQPDLQIVLMDGSPQVTELCVAPRISHTLGFNIAQSIALVPRLDFLVSIDSWSKYPAAWSKVPQLIIVPDQRSEYPGLTAEKLLCDEFSGIFDNPKNTLIGLEGPRSSPTLTLGALAELTPERLLTHTCDCLSALPRSS